MGVPAASTNPRSTTDHSRPLEPTHCGAFNDSHQNPNPASSSLERPPECHSADTIDTIDTDWAQNGHELSHLERAIAMTKAIGISECNHFRKAHFLQYEPICLTLASGHLKIYRQEGYVKANQSLPRKKPVSVENTPAI